MRYRLGKEILSVGINAKDNGASEVILTPEDGNPTALECRLTAISGHAYSFELGSHRYPVHAVRGPAGWYVGIGGHQFLVEPPELIEQERRRGAQVDAEKHVTPPMPGQVIKILVTVGDRIEAEQPVVVISAMKMETTLTSPHAGAVSAINTEVGAQVAPGDILIDIEEWAGD